MKYRLTILISIVVGFNLHSQSYVPFPKTSAYWDQYVCGPFKFPYDFQIGLEDSTEIEGQYYRNMSMFYFGWEQFYLREDSLHNVYIRFTEEVNIPKLHFQNYPLNQDLLLYSFNNLQESDTIFYPYANSYAVVYNVDSVLVFDSYRKRYHVEVSGDGEFWPDEGTWIEGLGDMNGLLKLWQWDFEWVIKLCEFGLEDSSGEYSSYNPADCEFLDIAQEDDLEFHFYPNPFTNTLKYSCYSHSLMDIVIYDQYGHPVKHYNNVEPTGALDLSDLTIGCYFLECMSESKFLNRHMIVKYD